MHYCKVNTKVELHVRFVGQHLMHLVINSYTNSILDQQRGRESSWRDVLIVFLLLCAVDKHLDAKIEPHRARSVTYAI